MVLKGHVGVDEEVVLAVVVVEEEETIGGRETTWAGTSVYASVGRSMKMGFAG